MNLQELIEKHGLKAGDKVRCIPINSRASSWYTEGKMYVLVEGGGDLSIVDNAGDFNTLALRDNRIGWELSEPEGAAPGYGPWESYLPGGHYPNAITEYRHGLPVQVARYLPKVEHLTKYYRLTSGGIAHCKKHEAHIQIDWESEDGTPVDGSLRMTDLRKVA